MTECIFVFSFLQSLNIDLVIVFRHGCEMYITFVKNKCTLIYKRCVMIDRLGNVTFHCIWKNAHKDGYILMHGMQMFGKRCDLVYHVRSMFGDGRRYTHWKGYVWQRHKCPKTQTYNAHLHLKHKRFNSA